MDDNGAPKPILRPYEAAIEGWNPDPDSTQIGDDWANTVSVRVVTGWAAPSLNDGDSYADNGEQRELIEIDTNYKETRPGPYPVRLTRASAVELAGHLLGAAEDTFHYARIGRLRAAESAALLRSLECLETSLQEIREHAFQDLLLDVGIDDF